MPKPFKWDEPSESDIEDAILELLRYQVGCFAFKVKVKATLDPVGGFYRKLPRYMYPGTPDIIACVSVKGIPIFVGLEVKNEKGRQSKDQKEFQERLKDSSDGFYFVVRSMKEAEIALKTVRENVSKKIEQYSQSVSKPFGHI